MSDECCVPDCGDDAELPYRLISISVDPLSATSPHAGRPIAIVPLPMCALHAQLYRRELGASEQRLVGRMMLASLARSVIDVDEICTRCQTTGAHICTQP